jgi:hypothetical protein
MGKPWLWSREDVVQRRTDDDKRRLDEGRTKEKVVPWHETREEGEVLGGESERQQQHQKGGRGGAYSRKRLGVVDWCNNDHGEGGSKEQKKKKAMNQGVEVLSGLPQVDKRSVSGEARR